MSKTSSLAMNVSGDSNENASIKEKYHTLVDMSKDGAKKLFSSRDSQEDPALQEIKSNPAFNPSDVVDNHKHDNVAAGDRIIKAMQTAGTAITHPRATIRKRATRNFAQVRPYQSKEADLEYLEAHEQKDNAEEQRDLSSNIETAAARENQVESTNHRVQRLTEKRLSMRAAYITNRHVQRVQVVDGKVGRFPNNKVFEVIDASGKRKYDWKKWLGYRVIYHTSSIIALYVDDFEEPPFNLDTLSRHFERLIVASLPMQSFVSEVFHIAKWESPSRTGKWLVLYISLWYTNHIATFVYGYLIYMVIRNYWYQTSLELDDLDESMRRSLNREATAFKMTELMDRYGEEDWIGALLDQLGPFLQMECHDLADALEVLYNFYHWKFPAKTRATLVFFFSCLLLCLFGSPEFCLRIVYFLIGCGYFLCFPIMVRFPRYRLVVNPFKWVFWDIPTHAEWSFKYLQFHSSKATTELQYRSADESDSDSSVASFETVESAPSPEPVESDISSFRCTYRSRPGRLTIGTTGIRFMTSLSRLTPSNSSVDFSYSFSQIYEMRKRNPMKRGVITAAKVMPALNKLELRIRLSERPENDYVMGEKRQESVVILEAMKGRDRAFNLILGFSQARWQNLQGDWK